MREIKFRGKRRDNGQWIEGLPGYGSSGSIGMISGWFGDDGYETYANIEVIEETIGQFTGEKDKNGKEIFEGDKVKRVEINYAWDEIDNPKVEKFFEETSFVVYHGHGFWIKDESFGWEGEGLWSWGDLEVVGNIHDTLEPIK